MIRFLSKHKLFITVFLFFVVLIFSVFWKQLYSYFEADDWFHFTAYLPLTREPQGAFVALFKSITDAHLLSGGQHFVPVGGSIYFLNTLFFGIYYPPYAFTALVLHVINTFFVFFLIKLLLESNKTNKMKQNDIGAFNKDYLMSILGGVFFALSAVSIPNITWAAFYGQNVFSVTLFLLCIITFILAIREKKKKLLVLSILLFFIDIWTKETAASLFIILPVIALLEKRVFPLRFLFKFYIVVVILFFLLRFVIPQISLGMSNVTDIFKSGTTAEVQQTARDTNTIGSTDLSIHKNIKAELLFRAVTFPIKMFSEMYFPRNTVQDMVTAITPIVNPLPGENEELNKTQSRQFFINGPGNDMIVYILSILLLTILGFTLRNYYLSKEIHKMKALLLGLVIVIASTWPLVGIVLSLPRWGYDTYFDQRHYYMPSIGGAILFPFLLYAISRYISSLIRFIAKLNIHYGFIAALLFLGWFINNITLVQAFLHKTIDQEGIPRRNIIYQMKQQLPVLPDKAVISVQTDGLNAYGSQLPFQTSFAQILSIIYYDSNPLPNSFFTKPILNNQTEGYQYADGRGLGYYTSKKSLADDLLQKKFNVSDIYAFSFISDTNTLTQTTEEVRNEMKQYLKKSTLSNDWQIFDASTSAESVIFKVPPSTEIAEIPVATTEAKMLRNIVLSNSNFESNLKIIRTVPTYDANEALLISDRFENSETIPYKANYDAYHFQDLYKTTAEEGIKYTLKIDDLLITMQTSTGDPTSIDTIERILGSIQVRKK